MTCNFFTIVKSYFHCCISKKDKDHEGEPVEGNPCLYPPSGEHSPFSFDDLTNDSENTSSTPISSWSSASSLEDYRCPPPVEKHKQHIKESLYRVKKYNQQFLHRHYADVYQTSS
jgi:hypothetical protein